MAYVYILQSQKNKRYYIGSTKNISQRMHFHESGNVYSTKNLLPVVLVFKQEYANTTVARKIEQRLKKLKRRDYLTKIIKEGIIKTSGG